MYIMYVEQKIATALLALVDNRAYPVVLPQNPEYPSIVWNRIDSKMASGDDFSVFFPEGITGRKSVYQVVIYTRQYQDSVQLLRDTVQAMEQIENCYLDDMADGYDHDLDVFSTVQNFVVWNELADKTAPDLSQETPVDRVLESVRKNLSGYFDITVYAKKIRNLSVQTVPFIMLDISDMDYGTSKGNDQCAIKLYFMALCVHDNKNRALWLAARLIEYIRYRHWDLGDTLSHPATINANYNDITRQGYVWQVGWSQQYFLPAKIDDFDNINDINTIWLGINDDGYVRFD